MNYDRFTTAELHLELAVAVLDARSGVRAVPVDLVAAVSRRIGEMIDRFEEIAVIVKEFDYE